MLLCELFNTDGLKLDTFENFMNSLKYIPKDQLEELQGQLRDINKELMTPLHGLTKLYHGTPTNIAQLIVADGYKLTMGQRQGFMGAINKVMNKGIFLSDSKKLANYYGSNRSEYGIGHKVLECYVDTTHVLDCDAAPLDVRKLGLNLLLKWDGIKRSKIPVAEWWWLLDIDEFVALIKSHGYNGIRFKEDKAMRQKADDIMAHTIMIFDPSDIKELKNYSMNVRQFYEHLKATEHN